MMGCRELAEKVFRKEAMGCGFIEGGYVCFEEDCDAQVALRELMDKKMIQAPVNEHFGPGEVRNRTEYDWGTSFSDLFSAEKDLVARAKEEVQCLEDQRQNTIVPEAPSYSPWGNIQECETLCPGVYSVSTPGHGGIMVRRELAEKIFRKEAMGCGFIEGGYLCFEEDCDAQVALRELMDKKMIQAPVNERFGPGAYEAVINSSVQIHHPEYWQAREKAISEQNRQAKKKGRER